MESTKRQRWGQRCGAGLITFLISLTFLIPNVIAQSVDDPEIHKLRMAQSKVDQAWDIFHEAALGGTLASPALQTEIETDLHNLRGLLAQSWEAIAAGDRITAANLIERIEQLTDKVADQSRQRKN